jgi:hypothetical protein
MSWKSLPGGLLEGSDRGDTVGFFATRPASRWRQDKK